MSDNSAIEWTEWVAVPGFPRYAVTQAGDMLGPRGVLRPMAEPSGHLHIIANRRKLRVHHAVLFAFVGPRPVGQECRHLDGNPANNHLDNLRWGTRLENSADKTRHGTELHGESKPGARLTVEQVRSIRVDPRAARAVGAEYGVSHTAVLRIRRGERWRAA